MRRENIGKWGRSETGRGESERIGNSDTGAGLKTGTYRPAPTDGPHSCDGIVRERELGRWLGQRLE
jgi:hypothetical protein